MGKRNNLCLHVVWRKTVKNQLTVTTYLSAVENSFILFLPFFSCFYFLPVFNWFIFPLSDCLISPGIWKKSLTPLYRCITPTLCITSTGNFIIHLRVSPFPSSSSFILIFDCPSSFQWSSPWEEQRKLSQVCLLTSQWVYTIHFPFVSFLYFIWHSVSRHFLPHFSQHTLHSSLFMDVLLCSLQHFVFLLPHFPPNPPLSEASTW